MEKKSLIEIPTASDMGELWTLGGPIWIDFANSLVLASLGMRDVTGSAESLHWWLGGMGLLTPDRLDPEDLRFASTLRKVCACILDNIQSGTAQSLVDLELLNRVLRVQRAWNELEQLESGAIIKRDFRANDTIQQALGPIVLSLVEILTKGDPKRIRTCAHQDCILRFYDDSKNGSRRWCSMSHCGNRAKATAFLDRKRSKGG